MFAHSYSKLSRTCYGASIYSAFNAFLAMMHDIKLLMFQIRLVCNLFIMKFVQCV